MCQTCVTSRSLCINLAYTATRQPCFASNDTIRDVLLVCLHLAERRNSTKNEGGRIDSITLITGQQPLQPAPRNIVSGFINRGLGHAHQSPSSDFLVSGIFGLIFCPKFPEFKIYPTPQLYLISHLLTPQPSKPVYQ